MPPHYFELLLFIFLRKIISYLCSCLCMLNFSDADVPFFLVCIDPNSLATVKHIKDWETCESDGNKVCL